MKNKSRKAKKVDRSTVRALSYTTVGRSVMAAASAQRSGNTWMSIGEVLAETGLAAGTIYRKIREGKLTAFELAGKTVVSRGDLNAFMKPVRLGPRKRGATTLMHRAALKTTARVPGHEPVSMAILDGVIGVPPDPRGQSRRSENRQRVPNGSRNSGGHH
jgi:predicted DNA-binding transcriptional regulator AlpA